MKHSTPVYTKRKVAPDTATTPQVSDRKNNIDLKVIHVCEHNSRSVIRIHMVRSNQQPADILTKTSTGIILDHFFSTMAVNFFWKNGQLQLQLLQQRIPSNDNSKKRPIKSRPTHTNNSNCIFQGDATCGARAVLSTHDIDRFTSVFPEMDVKFHVRKWAEILHRLSKQQLAFVPTDNAESFHDTSTQTETHATQSECAEEEL